MNPDSWWNLLQLLPLLPGEVPREPDGLNFRYRLPERYHACHLIFSFLQALLLAIPTKVCLKASKYDFFLPDDTTDGGLDSRGLHRSFDEEPGSVPAPGYQACLRSLLQQLIVDFIYSAGSTVVYLGSSEVSIKPQNPVLSPGMELPCPYDYLSEMVPGPVVALYMKART